jgi:glycosyltransferase involved in cell wall biosynthesis
MQSFVTLIMPVRNEAGFIRRSLGAVLAQDYPRDCLEIIVADGLSTDETRNIVRSLAGENPELQLIDNPSGIVPTGINAALAHARGEIIVRVDGHCEIAPDYVSRCVHHLLVENVDGVGGPIETIGETTTARAIALAMSSKFGVGGSAFRTVKDQTMFTDTVAFPAYTRAAMTMAGPFDEELVRNQDDEYNYRLRKLGARILLASDIRSRYYSRGSLRSLGRQYFQYGYWKVRVLQKHPLQMRLRQFVPIALVSALLITLLGAVFSTPLAWMFGFLALTYVSTNLAASMLTARKGNWFAMPTLPVAFVMLHFGYGFGFLLGLVRFWNRWGDSSGRPVSAETSFLKTSVITSLSNGSN